MHALRLRMQSEDNFWLYKALYEAQELSSWHLRKIVLCSQFTSVATPASGSSEASIPSGSRDSSISSESCMRQTITPLFFASQGTLDCTRS